MLHHVATGHVARAVVVVVSAVLLTGGCSSADDATGVACRLDEADGVTIDDATIQLAPDGSGSLTDTARLVASFTDQSFGYVEGYADDEGLDLRLADGSLTVTVDPASSEWYQDQDLPFGLIRVWERPAPECGRFATLKLAAGRT